MRSASRRGGKLTDYDVRMVPAPKNFLEQFIEDASGAGDDAPGLDIRSKAMAAGPAPSSNWPCCSCGTSTRPGWPP